MNKELLESLAESKKELEDTRDILLSDLMSLKRIQAQTSDPHLKSKYNTLRYFVSTAIGSVKSAILYLEEGAVDELADAEDPT